MVIDVSPLGDNQWRVRVEDKTTTEHTVTVRENYSAQIGAASVSAEDLLRASFEFLLERESNTSILARFDLPVIQRYFPEYERTMAARFGAS